MSFGEPGDKPGQFNTPHSIAADAQGNIYVADRGNRRIQVFNGDGKFLRQITIDVPFDYASATAAIGKKPAPDATGTQASGSPWAICITPGPNQVAIRLRRVSRTHLQAQPRRHDTWRARRNRQTAQAIRLDPRDRVPVRERALCRRAAELASAEARPASKEIIVRKPVVPKQFAYTLENHPDRDYRVASDMDDSSRYEIDLPNGWAERAKEPLRVKAPSNSK